MSKKSIAPFLCSILAMVSVGVGAATPAQSIEAKLQDSTTDPSIAHMRIVLDHETVKPGRVVLHAQNESKTLVHELVVVRDDGGKTLPFDAKHSRVIESKVHRLGEISDLKPGTAGKLTLNLRPGSYVLMCNEPGHYKDGMLARLTVAR